MNITEKQSLKGVGWIFFIVVTVMETLLLCALFNTFTENIVKLIMVATTVLVFNLATWFFALKYEQTLLSLKRKK